MLDARLGRNSKVAHDASNPTPPPSPPPTHPHPTSTLLNAPRLHAHGGHAAPGPHSHPNAPHLPLQGGRLARDGARPRDELVLEGVALMSGAVAATATAAVCLDGCVAAVPPQSPRRRRWWALRPRLAPLGTRAGHWGEAAWYPVVIESFPLLIVRCAHVHGFFSVIREACPHDSPHISRVAESRRTLL